MGSAMRIAHSLFLLLPTFLAGCADRKLPSFGETYAATHELLPHRRIIPTSGVENDRDFDIRLTLTISKSGDVVSAKPEGRPDALRYWPQLQDEVNGWKFMPFAVNGAVSVVQVDESIDVVPLERLPTRHIEKPILNPDSQIRIVLRRSACYGDCPDYTVEMTNDEIKFEGRLSVVAMGKHKAPVNPQLVRALAQKFVDADFYSMDEFYAAHITDSPGYLLCLAIDNQKKQVHDYVGYRVGMPSIITELQKDVDSLAGTTRWIEGNDGLAGALKDEHFDFHAYDAQVILQRAAVRGQAKTVHELIEAGVPLTPLPGPKGRKGPPFDAGVLTGFLQASSH